jgi:hypothetical protein
MKPSLSLSVLLATVCLMAGCASPQAATAEPAIEKEYTTGSNIPRNKGAAKPGVTTIDRDDLERQRVLPPPVSAPMGR